MPKTTHPKHSWGECKNYQKLYIFAKKRWSIIWFNDAKVNEIDVLQLGLVSCIVKKERSNSYSVYRCSCQVRDLHTLNSFSFFFLGKICHFIDGLQHSPFYRWKSRCCFFFNDSYTNHYFMRIMFSLWGQSTWSIYQIQGSQIYILQHNVYSTLPRTLQS